MKSAEKSSNELALPPSNVKAIFAGEFVVPMVAPV
jgi:hypothetical protein